MWVCDPSSFSTVVDLEAPSGNEVKVGEEEPRSVSQLSSLLDSQQDIDRGWNVRDSVESTWRCVGGVKVCRKCVGVSSVRCVVRCVGV